MVIEKNRAVSIHYTLTDDSGKVLDSSEGAQPLTYIHGRGNLIPGLESALNGKKAGDNLKVAVKPQDGYGLRNEEMIMDVPLEALKDVPNLRIGMPLEVQSDNGAFIMVVTEINGDKAKLDGNHPLAGQNLNFAVNVTDIREATSEELEHGHIHSSHHDHDGCGCGDSCGCGDHKEGESCGCGDGKASGEACGCGH